MKKWSAYFCSDKGMTLIEILASMVILSVIVVSLLSMFVQSARSNNVSKTIMGATYIAETHMEEIYSLAVASTSLDIASTAIVNKGYTLVSKTSEQASYGRNVTGHYVFIELASASGDPLVKAKVKVFKDQSKSVKEAQMEMLIAWKK